MSKITNGSTKRMVMGFQITAFSEYMVEQSGKERFTDECIT